MAKIDIETQFHPIELSHLSSQHRTLSFGDIGQSWPIETAAIVNFVVEGKRGKHLGQILRLYSGKTFCKEDGELILTQALERYLRPTIGRTAFLTPIGERLFDAEERIALNLYKGRAPNSSPSRHLMP